MFKVIIYQSFLKSPPPKRHFIIQFLHLCFLSSDFEVKILFLFRGLSPFFIKLDKLNCYLIIILLSYNSFLMGYMKVNIIIFYLHFQFTKLFIQRKESRARLNLLISFLYFRAQSILLYFSFIFEIVVLFL